MSSDPSNWVLFLGRFHPLLVHLPIGGLLLLGVLELFAWLTPWKEAAQNRKWILGFVCVGALASAGCGLMLSTDGGYDPNLIRWHRATGLALTGICFLTMLLLQVGRLRAYLAGLMAALLMLGIASHLGGSITHGRDYLTRYAPTPIRRMLGEAIHRATSASAAVDGMEQPAFSGIIQPILRNRCSSCHGSEKQKGKLRLDTLEGLLKGGEDGPVIEAGHARGSPLIKRLRLDPTDDDHMPPDGKPQPTPGEVDLLEWWIDNGAPTNATVAELRPNSNIRRLVRALRK